MKTALWWIVGLAASLGAHGALFAFLVYASAPKPLEATPSQSSKIKMTSYEVPQSKAVSAPAKGKTAAANEARGQALGQGSIPSQTAAAAPLPQSLQPGITPPSVPATALWPKDMHIAEIHNETVVKARIGSGAASPTLPAHGPHAKAALPRPAPLASIAPPPVTPVTALHNTALVAAAAPLTQAALTPRMPSLAATAAPGARTSPSPLANIALASARPHPLAIGPSAADSGSIVAEHPAPQASAQMPATGRQSRAHTPPAQPAMRRAPKAPLARQAPVRAPVIAAATGWSGDTAFDPSSLKAIQSFMQPLDTSQRADTPRDAISQILASVPCARLAARFVPETGRLEVRGQIPNEAVRQPILTAIRQQLGASIPVGGSMLVLPPPQCDVLSKVENIGLPQSQGQKRDAKELGAITQMATFDYGKGARVIIKMNAPDYPAYVYVDFFDAKGRVLHLRPNQWENVELQAPNEPLEIGADRNGKTSVKLIVQPPYGQELAIAYASSSRLYDGLRDTIEPAQPYLDFLRQRVAALKAADPNYKGEWVYMFVQTHE